MKYRRSTYERQILRSIPRFFSISHLPVPDQTRLDARKSNAVSYAHTGRKSGLTREFVLKIVRCWAGTNTYVVASTKGEKAGWYQNVLQTPEVLMRPLQTSPNETAG